MKCFIPACDVLLETRTFDVTNEFTVRWLISIREYSDFWINIRKVYLYSKLQEEEKYSLAHMLQWVSYVEEFQHLFIGERLTDVQFGKIHGLILYNSQ